MSAIDISVIITAHGEGLLAGISACSADSAINVANAAGLRCETVVVLDRADSVTTDVLTCHYGDRARILETREGDPGLARNRGVEAAAGCHAAFLDGDDLWSENWLVEAHRLLAARPDIIAHSACNIVFGAHSMLWWHADSESSTCDHSYLEWMNYWDALAFARRALLLENPFVANDLKRGYGHEDWHWNQTTVARGIPHKPVPETIHFKRRRTGSQSDLVDRRGGLPWPTSKGGREEEPTSLTDRPKPRPPSGNCGQ
ncbi:glycosyltransferase [Meridianimarinicoccus sp. RP-17]|uniref:glycosyltransferase family A protein n=1 Tax=Meridianimarinicoccus zhengii TaxID=2056810 RepID=UPI000DABA860|nr:glycosyltransferase family A protein [Phycocomes zhengii]